MSTSSHTSTGSAGGRVIERVIERVMGQSRAIGTLTKSMMGGHVHHAWIFHGPFGVGKRTAAVEFARLLLDPATTSEAIERFAPVRGTEVDRLVGAGTHPDLHIITKERTESSAIASLRDKKQTNIPVDLLRELMLGGTIDGKQFDGAVWRTPYLGHGKVFIIDEAELLDEIGQNALLKTLEEPPPGTTIILVTTREDRLLPTIRSRCQRVQFGLLDPNAMGLWLANAKTTAGLELDSAAMAWIARFAEGSPGMAVLAAKHGVHEWAREFAGPLGELSRGRFVGGLSERMAEVINECAEAVVKENDRASKEAANRLGSRLLFGVLGQVVRDGIDMAVRQGRADEADRWGDIADVLSDADEEVRRSINLKQVLALLVARWTAIGESGGLSLTPAGAKA
jgi:DNA polymerase-3 subunit delta'